MIDPVAAGAETLFGQALELPLDQQEQFVDQAGADSQVRERAKALLHRHREMGDFLAEPVIHKLRDATITERPHTFVDGQQVAGRYRILRLLNAGGMGEVYEAQDTILNRAVALKTILPRIAHDPAAVSRFRQEVAMAGEVTHPNVCRVFDFGEHRDEPHDPGIAFMTMQLLHGETLAERVRRAGKLSIAEAEPLLRQMADALACAHRAGVVHRDFKPANVMLVQDAASGQLRAMVTDFGLAHTSSADRETGTASESGPLIGTPDYMAPEQWMGQPATPATDIFAFGLVAYHVLTGRKPATNLAENRLDDIAAPFDRLIRSCIEAAPSLRPAGMAAVVALLTPPPPPPAPVRPWGTRLVAAGLAFAAIAGIALLAMRARPPAGLIDPSSSSTYHRVAVLPLEVRGGASGGIAPHLADGISEELARALGTLRGVQVVATQSSFAFRQISTNLSGLGKQLGVDLVLSGEIGRKGDGFVIAASLASIDSGRSLWSEELQFPPSGLQAAEERIAAAVGKVLKTSSPIALAGPGRTPRFDAHDLYLMGRFHLEKRGEENVRRSHDLFRRALELDPQYARAWSGLADALLVLAEWGRVPSRAGLEEARRAALRAVELAPNLAEGYKSLAYASFRLDHSVLHAEQHFAKAVELDPNLAGAHQWYSYLLMKVRRFDAAMTHARIALDLDPLSQPTLTNMTSLLFYMRDEAGLRRHCAKVKQWYPQDLLCRCTLARVYALRGLSREANAELDGLGPVAEHQAALRFRAETQAILGQPRESQATLDKILAQRAAGTAVPAFNIASAAASMGKVDEAFYWLEKGWADFDGTLDLLHINPAFDSLRNDPRYVSLVQRLGLAGDAALARN